MFGNKAVYTTASVASGWAGAIMIWAGAVMIWAGACSIKKFQTLKTPKNAKKAKCDGRTDGRTDGPTDTVNARTHARDKKKWRKRTTDASDLSQQQEKPSHYSPE